MVSKIVILLMSFAILQNVRAIDEECLKNIFNTTHNFMHFVKETTNAEYGIAGKFKALNCCAKGYRSIEWLKDGKQYPWRASSSTFILYPQSGNQTIYTNMVGLEDEGNYTCIVRNDTTFYSHTITLKIYDKAPEKPQPTYVSGNQEVSLGHSLRLFCEAFVGTVSESMPDGRNEVIWTKLTHNGTTVTFPDDGNLRVSSMKVSREDGQTFGTYLNIKEITPDDFGTYVCTIAKPGGAILEYVQIRERVFVEYLYPNPFPWKNLLIIASICLILLLKISILYNRFGLMLRVKFKDRFGALEVEDGKNVDVLIAYASPDSDFALRNLLYTLETKFNYSCESRELSTDINYWTTTLADASKKSRRLLAVLSPSALKDQWTAANLYNALKQLQSLDAHLFVVFLEEPPVVANETKNEMGETLGLLLKRIQHVCWFRENAQSFWLSVRLHMPPINSNVQCIDLTPRSCDTRLNPGGPKDTLDGLV